MQTLDTASVRLLASADTWMDGEVIRQLYAAANLEGVREVIGFPDVHPGPAYPVGIAVVSEGVFYPQLVGGDIGCGIGLWKTGLHRRKSRIERWAELRLDLEHPWEGDVHQRLAKAGLDPNLFSSALGTIGGGNHFAEIQSVEKVYDRSTFEQLDLSRDELFILVHSGSRWSGRISLGRVCRAARRRARRCRLGRWLRLPRRSRSSGALGSGESRVDCGAVCGGNWNILLPRP